MAEKKFKSYNDECRKIFVFGRTPSSCRLSFVGGGRGDGRKNEREKVSLIHHRKWMLLDNSRSCVEIYNARGWNTNIASSFFARIIHSLCQHVDWYLHGGILSPRYQKRARYASRQHFSLPSSSLRNCTPDPEIFLPIKLVPPSANISLAFFRRENTGTRTFATFFSSPLSFCRVVLGKLSTVLINFRMSERANSVANYSRPAYIIYYAV